MPAYCAFGSERKHLERRYSSEGTTPRVSIWNDASEEVGKIEMLDAATSDANVPMAPLTAPDQDYGGLTWTPLYLSDNGIGYTAAKGDGTYYFYGPDNVLYNDAYSGM